jgi:hypothetical protein
VPGSVKTTEPYDRDVLTLWNEFKELFATERKLNDDSPSKIYCKIKNEIEGVWRAPSD